MKARSVVVGLAGLLAAAGVVPSIQAAELNMGGSSAATPFGQQVPLSLCDSDLPVGANTKQFINGATTGITVPGSLAAGKLITWTCKVGGVNQVFRYSATGSSDGVNKLVAAEGSAGSLMDYLDETSLAGCAAPVSTTRPSDGKPYTLYSGCTTVVQKTTHIGFSDVHGSSFHQTGPIGTTVKPLNQGSLVSQQVQAVPFAIVVGKGVYEVNSNGTLKGRVTSLSRAQVEAIFSGSVFDWQQVGLGTSTNPSPVFGTTVKDSSSPVTLCQRKAGSGSKAAFAVTLMLSQSENTDGTTDLTDNTATAYFGGSTQDVINCVQGNGTTISPHPFAAAYMEVDQAISGCATCLQPGNGFLVKVDGASPFDSVTFPSDPKSDLKCGKYLYWSGERMNTRSTPPSGFLDPNAGSLAVNFINTAKSPGFLATVTPGVGTYWVAFGQMNVSKNADPGPINFTGSIPGPAVCVNH